VFSTSRKGSPRIAGVVLPQVTKPGLIKWLSLTINAFNRVSLAAYLGPLTYCVVTLILVVIECSHSFISRWAGS
jgi:hypothetical protein